jgi:hypothetical protein
MCPQPQPQTPNSNHTISQREFQFMILLPGHNGTATGHRHRRGKLKGTVHWFTRLPGLASIRARAVSCQFY